MNKLTKFFIICAIVLCLGLGLFLGGLWANGVEGVDKVAEGHYWLNGSPGKMQVEQEKGLEFDSVEAKGYLDLILVGTDYSSHKEQWEVSKQIAGLIEDNIPAEGTMFICYGENMAAPEYRVENGVLKINSTASDDGVVSMNLTSEDGVPKAIVFCGDETLKSINYESDDCDVAMLGVKYDSAELKLSDGEVFAECVKSGGLKVEMSDGDCNIHGDFEGVTQINSADGDVNVETSLAEESYNRNVQVTDGFFTVNDGEANWNEAVCEYIREGEPHQLIIKSSDGDVSLWFGNARF